MLIKYKIANSHFDSPTHQICVIWQKYVFFSFLYPWLCTPDLRKNSYYPTSIRLKKKIVFERKKRFYQKYKKKNKNKIRCTVCMPKVENLITPTRILKKFSRHYTFKFRVPVRDILISKLAFCASFSTITTSTPFPLSFDLHHQKENLNSGSLIVKNISENRRDSAIDFLNYVTLLQKLSI